MNISLTQKFFIALILLTSVAPFAILSSRAEDRTTAPAVIIPFYPGASLIPSHASSKENINGGAFQNVNLFVSEGFKKVLTYYQDKLGKFSIFGSHGSGRSALWHDSNNKGYRIVTLRETREGTAITITTRIW